MHSKECHCMFIQNQIDLTREWYLNFILTWGTWIAEWYHTLNICTLCHTLGYEFAPQWRQTLYQTQAHQHFLMILFDLFNLTLLFVCQICHVNCETENWKWKIFLFGLQLLVDLWVPIMSNYLYVIAVNDRTIMYSIGIDVSWTSMEALEL